MVPSFLDYLFPLALLVAYVVFWGFVRPSHFFNSSHLAIVKSLGKTYALLAVHSTPKSSARKLLLKPI